MRLDKILSDSGLFTRREAGDAIRRGRVTVDGAVCRDPGAKFDENSAVVEADGDLFWESVMTTVLFNGTNVKILSNDKIDGCILVANFRYK